MQAQLGPIYTMRHVSIPSPFRLHSVRMVCVHTVRHLPERYVIGGAHLFPLNMQPTATECIFRYLLIIRTSVTIEW
jgi:hypothetical protein